MISSSIVDCGVVPMSSQSTGHQSTKTKGAEETTEILCGLWI